MLICPKCNKELEDGAKFCDACGAKIFETIFCPNCGEKTSSEFAFCEQCGASIQEDVTVKAKTEETAKETPESKTKKLPKIPLIGGAIVLVAVVAIVLISQLFKGGAEKEYCVYFKNDELVYDDFTEDGAFELTSRFLDNVSYDYEYEYYLPYQLAAYTQFSEDGKYVFYPDRVDEDADGLTIYCRNVNKEDEEPIKIDSDITQYTINADGTKVVYLKGEDGGLYEHDLKDKEKIASEVSEFYTTDDLKKVGYLKYNGGYYTYTEGEESEKLVSDIESIVRVGDELEYVYFKKDGGLYAMTDESGDYNKIASDVSTVEKIYDSGEIYYTTEEIVETTLADYVIDDMKEADAKLTEPEYPDYPSWWDYDTDEEYEAAMEKYEKEYEEYEEAYYEYSYKEDRDYLRESLEEYVSERYVYSLYYYDGEESTLITDQLTEQYLPTSEETSAIYFKEYNEEDMPKVKLSEIYDAYDVEEIVWEALEGMGESRVAVKDQVSNISQTDVASVTFSADGKSLYFLADVSDEGNGDLYEASIKDGAVANAEVVDNDVSDANIIANEDALIYFKNYDSENYRGDIWIDGKEVDYETYVYDIQVKDGVVYYTSDWNFDKDYGTLKMYKNGEATKVADDVSTWKVKGDNIIYLYDYSYNSYTGTLYIYKNGESEKISDDVSFIVI